MSTFTPLHRFVLAILLIVAGFGALPARAQDVPDAQVQEAMIKQTLITFNDANMTGNYAVMHARTAAPFREQFPPARIAEMFKSFGEQDVDIGPVAGMDPIEDTPAVVEDGILILAGHFATSPLQVNYVLKYLVEENAWRLVGIDVTAVPVEE